MKFLSKAKDGGPESNVTGYWLFETKSLGSIVLLRFDEGSREAYHNHAFNSISWVLKGQLREQFPDFPKRTSSHYFASLWPIWTPKKCMHKVFGVAPKTWVLSFRGPWDPTWKELVNGKEVVLTNGRKIVN